jgi:hypothetical protein
LNNNENLYRISSYIALNYIAYLLEAVVILIDVLSARVINNWISQQGKNSIH